MAAFLKEQVVNMSGIDESILCQIEATVATGFEEYAQEEIKEKMGADSTSKRGSVDFQVPISRTKELLELCSIDNISVVLNRYPQFKFADNIDDCMKQLVNLVPEVNWQTGLAVWHKFFTFDHPISHTGKPKQEQEQQPPVEEKQGAEGEPPKKKPKDPLMPAFRSTCYRSGKHIFQSPQAAANFGGAIQDHFGWNVDLKNHDIEVVLNIDSDNIYIAINLTRESLHKRHLVQFGPTTLRPTIAYGMLRFCKVKPGDIVCDPMCGGGTIPIEASLNWPTAYHLCGDSFEQCPPRTQENFKAVDSKRTASGKKRVNVDTLHWDVTNLPLLDNSVDVFITDLPFGKRSGSKMRNWHLYPLVLKEMARVCRTDTGRVCLLTQDRKCLIKSLELVRHLWRRGPTLGINIGGLAAGVYLLYRTGAKYEAPKKKDKGSNE